jgi:hypothetical protein
MPRQVQDLLIDASECKGILFRDTPACTAPYAPLWLRSPAPNNAHRPSVAATPSPSAANVLVAPWKISRLLDNPVKVENMRDSLNVAELAGPLMLPALVHHKLLQIRH